MRLTATLLLSSCLLVCARTDAQTVTLKVSKTPVKEIFRAIEKQTGLSVIVDEALLEKAGTVALDVRDMPVAELLNICLRNLGLSYSIADGRIVVKAKPAPIPLAESAPSYLDIKGRITDSLGNPLEGASVTIKGTRKGTQSDSGGNFNLKGVDSRAILVISFTGFESQEIAVAGKSQIVILMRQGTASMQDVIVNKGYYTTSQRFNTGSVSTVTQQEIAEQPVSNILMAVQGRAPGMLITSNSGVPGSDITVQIRGLNSVGAGSHPLYIIDGVPVTSEPINTIVYTANGNISPLSAINPGDIESISILKDADATAIYGSRGANGVVLITSKSGRSGKTKFDVDLNTGISNSSRFIPFLNTHDYLRLRRAAFAADGVTPTVGNAPDLLLWDTTVDNNWQKILLGRPDPVSNAQLTLSGGDQKNRFLIGFGYHNEGSVLLTGGYQKRANLHVNLEHNSVDKRFNMNFTMSYGNDRLKTQGANPVGWVATPPDQPKYDSAGKPYWYVGESAIGSPMAGKYTNAKTTTDNIISSMELRYKLTSNIDIKTRVGYSKQYQQQLSNHGFEFYNPAVFSYNYAEFGNSFDQTFNLEPQLNYTGSIAKGKLNVLAGGTLQSNTSGNNYIDVSGFPTDALLESVNAAATVDSKSNASAEYRYESAYGRANYIWDEKYVLNGTFRTDGSSRFGPGKRFGNFWSLGGAWLFSEENWIKNDIPVISFGKLRASYGVTGNDQIGNYGYLQTYGASDYPYLGNTGLTPQTLANPDYSWEINRKIELALEISLWKNRISLTAVVFRNRSGNQLVNYPLPSQTGFTSYEANLNALVQNKGLELEITTKNIVSKSFQWTTSINLTVPKNTLLKFPGLAASSYALQYDVGQPLNILKQFHFTGIDPKTGVPTFLDVNQDGQLDYGHDYVNAGSLDPSYYGGLSNSFVYKALTLDIFFQFQKQIGYGYLGNFYQPPGTMYNVSKLFATGYWQKPGDNAVRPGLTATVGSDIYNAYTNYYTYSNEVLSDASYIRLKNVSISYSLNKKWISHSGFQNARIFLHGQNLLTFTNYNGMDPETKTGIPVLRTFVAGLHLTL